MREINLNADLGESYGAYTIGDDLNLLDIVASANVACGFHGGDPLVMLKTIEAAKARGVSIGGHPSFPDRQGFGRRKMVLSPAELEAMMLYQLAALAGVAQARGAAMTHVKPHGALNNMACEDAVMADAIAKAVTAFNRDLILLAPALSELAAAGQRAGLRVAMEIFADRAYTDHGTLVPRGQPGAMIHGGDASRDHVLRMIEEQALVSVSGKRLPCAIHSICVHGDEPTAVEAARVVRQGLVDAGLAVLPLPDLAALT